MDDIEKELHDAYVGFYRFALSLIESLNKNNGNLKFAVVNMQISLELFLKYYFIKKQMPDRVFSDPSNPKDFKDFSVILHAYFSTDKNDQLIRKKHLTLINETRNSIVHKGKFNAWDEDLANYIIACAFFIQGVSKKEFQETLIESAYLPHSMSSNEYWKSGASAIAVKLLSESGDEPMECPHCYSRALISKEIYNFDQGDNYDGLQCLACFVEIELEHSGTLIKCGGCSRNTFFVETLNQQPWQGFVGKCFNCGNSMDVKQCASCESYYFPDLLPDRTPISGKYYCGNTSCRVIAETK